MHYNTKLILFLIIYLIPISCSGMEDLDTIDIYEQKFTLVSEIKSDSIYNFIQITNQNNETIFDTTGLNLSGEFEFLVKHSDTLDVTFGFETHYFFDIKTIRDIPSGFVLTRDWFHCPYKPKIDYSSLNLAIEIKGINDYEEIYFPLNRKKISNNSKHKNRLSLSGTWVKNKDFLITIKRKQEPHKSYWVKKEHLKMVDEEENEYKISIDFNDFIISNIHKIEMPLDTSWMIYAQISTPGNRVITIASWNQKSDIQKSRIIKLFTTPYIKIDWLELNIRTNSFNSGHNFNRILESFPSKIDSYDPYIEFSKISHDQYKIHTLDEGNLFLAEYQYNNNNFIQSWKIYQLSASTMNLKTPSLPNEFLKHAPIARSLINSPTRFLGKLFTIQEGDLEEIYNLRNINKLLHCMDYSTKSISIKL